MLLTDYAVMVLIFYKRPSSYVNMRMKWTLVIPVTKHHIDITIDTMSITIIYNVYTCIYIYTIWLFNIAMDFFPIEIDGLPINSMVDLSMATLNIQRVGVPENSSLHIRPLSKGVVFWTD